MPPQETAQATFDFIAFFNEIIPFLATAGGVFGTYIAFGKWIKAWINKDCVTNDQLFDPEKGVIVQLEKKAQAARDKLKEEYDEELVEIKGLIDQKVEAVKQHAAEQLANHKERSDEKDDADKKWLRGLQERVEKLQIKVGA